MGVMTLDQFREDLVTGIQRGTQAAVGVPRLSRWIHNTMYEFGYAFKFHVLEGISDQIVALGASTFTKPADFRVMHELGIELYNVENFEGKVLPESREQYLMHRRTVGSAVVTGPPKKYHNYGNVLYFRPTADVAYKALVHYWKRIPLMTDDDEVSIFEADWDDIILQGAISRGFRHFNEFDRYQNVRNDYLGMIRSRKLEEDLEEFPEGGINPVTFHDRESDSIYGTPEVDAFGDPIP